MFWGPWGPLCDPLRPARFLEALSAGRPAEDLRRAGPPARHDHGLPRRWRGAAEAGRASEARHGARAACSTAVTSLTVRRSAGVRWSFLFEVLAKGTNAFCGVRDLPRGSAACVMCLPHEW
ncbi:unnamed protein product [Prorocentrum cordatum]|uniref:Uncharacterized protein n=1 Tax=Prorocentrum cordatum TaxID=2364126 RepID=A0ABN9VGB6_9DINO|nr:unnamed protein product [Polarella glacialis]